MHPLSFTASRKRPAEGRHFVDGHCRLNPQSWEVTPDARPTRRPLSENHPLCVWRVVKSRGLMPENDMTFTAVGTPDPDRRSIEVLIPLINLTLVSAFR